MIEDLESPKLETIQDSLDVIQDIASEMKDFRLRNKMKLLTALKIIFPGDSFEIKKLKMSEVKLWYLLYNRVQELMDENIYLREILREKNINYDEPKQNNLNEYFQHEIREVEVGGYYMLKGTTVIEKEDNYDKRRIKFDKLCLKCNNMFTGDKCFICNHNYRFCPECKPSEYLNVNNCPKCGKTYYRIIPIIILRLQDGNSNILHIRFSNNTVCKLLDMNPRNIWIKRKEIDLKCLQGRRLCIHGHCTWDERRGKIIKIHYFKFGEIPRPEEFFMTADPGT
ncbi:MAG: hypothetical protein GF329_18430 [Candidatus Lokiarchaeota archaeon]|nr:hypothetical protein [Candidatus Lokiarchaeota archaeon]